MLQLVLLCTWIWHSSGHAPLHSDPLPSSACQDVNNVTFFSYHVHVLFNDHNKSSRDVALEFQQQFSSNFNISNNVSPSACDDSNTTHNNQGAPTIPCMIDNDWGLKNYSVGHYGSPACPFLQAEWAVFLPTSFFGQVVPWFTKHKPNGVDVLIHPNSGCEAYDHRDWAIWQGSNFPHKLDFSCFHYDCPGCNSDDCRTRTRETVLSGKAEECGLVVDQKLINNVTEPYLRVEDRGEFCTTSCMHWAETSLPLWESECPSNCDYFKTGKESTECQAHTNSIVEVSKLPGCLCKQQA